MLEEFNKNMMTQEDKELLIKDLCARLPYGIKAQDHDDEPPFTIVAYDGLYFWDNDEWEHKVDKIKPYLFPLSSITEEQYYEMMGCSSEDCLEHMEILKSLRECTDFTHWPLYEYRVIDWFNKNRFDYRGLIPKGRAIDATNKNIY